MNILCECPACDEEINLRGYKENDEIVCPECEIELEIVSLRPPVLEEPLDDDDEWEEDDEEWGEENEDDDADEDDDEIWQKGSRLEWDAVDDGV